MSTETQQALKPTDGVQDTNIPPFKYKCFHPDCSFASKVRSSFNFHLASHTGDKAFRCVICKKRYTASFTLLKHQRDVHGQVVFVDSSGEVTSRRWTNPTNHPLLEAYLDMGRTLWHLLIQDRLHVEVPDEAFSVVAQDGVTIVTWRGPVMSSTVPLSMPVLQDPVTPSFPAASPSAQVNVPAIASTPSATLQPTADNNDVTISTNNAVQDTMLCDTNGEYGDAFERGGGLRPLLPPMPPPAVTAPSTRLGSLAQQQAQEKLGQPGLALDLQLPGQPQPLLQRPGMRRCGNTDVRPKRDPYPRMNIGRSTESSALNEPSAVGLSQAPLLKGGSCISNRQDPAFIKYNVVDSIVDAPAGSNTHAAGNFVDYSATNTSTTTRVIDPIFAPAIHGAAASNHPAYNTVNGNSTNSVSTNTTMHMVGNLKGNFRPTPPINYVHPYPTSDGVMNFSHQVPVDQGYTANPQLQFAPNPNMGYNPFLPSLPASANGYSGMNAYNNANISGDSIGNLNPSNSGALQTMFTNEGFDSFFDMEMGRIGDGMDLQDEFMYPDNHGDPPAYGSSGAV
ncbi:hypothetical protein AX16_001680 [Volvariella volvacea WC 439]|nr:hypothetical protein AX16_001680 [Volvariella volvacea WC 439]